MSIENWIDKICALWEVSDGLGGNVKSFRVFEKDEFPESIPPDEVCAITYPQDMDSMYSTGGPNIDYWRGVTEFHFPWGVDKSMFPSIALFFPRIRNAAAGSMTLSGSVASFLLRGGEGSPSIQGPVVLQYGSEDPHHGLIINWMVKENATGETGYTPAQ